MKRLIFTSLLFIAPLCKAADEQFIEEHLANATQVWAENTAYLMAQSARYVSYYYHIYKARLRGSPLLYLTGYGLKNVPQELNLPGLRGLDLSNNQIQIIPQELNNLPWPWLRELSLNNNQIQTIPQALNLPWLEGLLLNDNKIQAIPQALNLPRLRVLYLNNNQIQAIDPHVLDQFPDLRELHVEENYLTEENINELRVYADGRDDLTITFGEQKWGRNTKGARR